MSIHTSYFDNVGKLMDAGYSNLVCVAGYAPKFFNDMPDAHFYPSLAPRKAWWREWHDNNLGNEWYVQRYYETVLAKLNPKKVLSDLGDNAVMLCYEPPGEFCHRHLIADWLNRTTGVEVDEISLNNNQQI